MRFHLKPILNGLGDADDLVLALPFIAEACLLGVKEIEGFSNVGDTISYNLLAQLPMHLVKLIGRNDARSLWEVSLV